MGYDTMRQHLTSQLGINLGETTADRRFTLLPIVCLGACDHAPGHDGGRRSASAIWIPDKIDELIEKYK